MKKIKLILPILLAVLCLQNLNAQDFTHPAAGASANFTVIAGTTHMYFDNGGDGCDITGMGSYSNNDPGSTAVLCPDDGMSPVTIEFLDVDIETRTNPVCWDFLTIYDGNSITAPQLFIGCGEEGFAVCPGGFAGDGSDGGGVEGGVSDIDGTNAPTPVNNIWTSSDASGCLTVNFTSDFAVDQGGWIAEVTSAAAPPAPGDPCTVVCPGDITLTLDPGDCNAYVNYQFGLTGDCVGIPAPLLDFTGAFDLAGAVDLGQNIDCIDHSGAPTTLVMKSADLGENTCIFFGTVQQFTVPADGTISFDWDYQVDNFGDSFWDPFGYALDLTGVLTLGNIQASSVQLTTDGTGDQSGSATVNVTAGQTFSFMQWTLDGADGEAITTIDNFVFQEAVTPATVAVTSGPASGEAFPIGTTTVEITATIPGEPDQTCTFDVTVNEFPDAINIVATQDAINVSLDEEGCALITADMVLTGGPYGCYDDYILTRDPAYTGTCPAGNGVSVDCSDIGTTITVTITDPDTGNSGWTLVTVEDKLAPTIECPNCNTNNFSGSFVDGVTPLHNRAFAVNPCFLSGIGSNVMYSAHEFDVTTAGDYTFTATSDAGPIFVSFYEIAFDPANACTNILAVETNNGPNTVRVLTMNGLAVGHYIFVVQGYFNGGTSLNYTVDISQEVAADCEFICTEQDDVLANIGPNATFPTATDNASACWAPTTTYNDVLVTDGGMCGDKVYERTWTAEDHFGRTSSCTYEFTIKPLKISDVEFPTDRDGINGPAFDCTVNADVTDPSSDAQHPNAGTVVIGGVPMYGGQGTTCNISVNYTDQSFDICENSYQILRTWTVVDMCTGLPATVRVQSIKVVDTHGPTIDGLFQNTINVSTSGSECYAHFFPQNFSATDDCSSPENITFAVDYAGTDLDVTWVSLGGTNGYWRMPVGNYDFNFTATDDCGNTTNQPITIAVTDNIDPSAICDEHTKVTLSNDWGGLARVYAATFDDGSTDNCDIDHFEVRRMNTHCQMDNQGSATGVQLPIGTSFGPYVDFCCDDTAGELGNDFIQVVFRVYDVNGNYSDCMVEVVVEDKSPAILTCPPNITITCDDLDGVLSNLGQFGTVQTDASLIAPVYNLDGSIAGFDGYTHDNCNLETTYTENINLDECHSGVITRTWTATDGINGTSTCTQVITVLVGASDFTVVFPNDVFINGDCSGMVNTVPVVSDDYCELVAIESIDETFDIVPDACYKIHRKWKVINWCVYELGVNNDDDINLALPALMHPELRKRTDGGDGYMEHTQIIKVLDDVAPVLDCLPDTMFGNYTADCGPVFVDLTPGMHDECTPDAELDLNNQLFKWVDGAWVNITGSGVGPITGFYENGRYKVDYYLSDKCGNTADCWFEFMIVDKKKPTPYCINPTTVVMQPEAGGCISLWATDFDFGSYDNCTAQEDLVLSIVDANGFGTPVPANISQDGFQGWTYCCADIAANGSEVFQLQLHVTDEAGNTEYCTLPVTIQANDNCTTAPGISVSGAIDNENDAAITGVDVTANYNSGTQNVTSDVNGYTFPGIPSGSDITVAPYSNDNPRNGVNTYDLVKIGRHILETEILDSPYKHIAADANHNGSITGADVVILRQLILFNTDEIANNTSWRFVDNAYNFTTSTPEAEDFAEVHTMNNVATNMSNIDFTAVKIGDVTGDASTNGLATIDPRDAGTVTFDVDNATLVSGEQVRVSFTSADLAKVDAYQFTLNFDKDAMSFDKVEAGALANLSEANFGMSLLSEGVITTSWNGNSSSDEVLFTLVFTANTSAELSNVLTLNSKVTEAGAYSANGSYNVELAFNGTVANAGFELMQNEPNPFTNATKIGYTLPTAGEATLTVRDLTGRIIYSETQSAVKGYNKFDVRSLKTSGVLYYTVESAEFTATKKMVIVK